ncbi:TOBE domain-containing protein, partial [Mesorhizobium sp. M0848]|uniref:TOBE domain-containing protein n=1 Tax=Mesorhizobium sp. M0848 TaxID=2957012 RepID=UPI00333A9B5C
NWFQGQRRGQPHNGVITYVTNGELEIRTRSQLDPQGSADLCVRPENIELVDVAAGGAVDDLAHNVLPGVVLDVAPLGADVHVVVELRDKSRVLVIRKNTAKGSGFVTGQPVGARFSASDVLIF